MAIEVLQHDGDGPDRNVWSEEIARQQRMMTAERLGLAAPRLGSLADQGFGLYNPN
jgi:hypothetical protein